MQDWVIAARSLLQHKKRTFLLGGAIAGVYTDEAMFQRLQQALQAIGCPTFKPRFVPPSPEV